MADQSLLDYLSGPAMTKLMDTPLIKRDIPWYLDQAILKPSPAKPVGINFQYEEYKGVRQGGVVTAYDSPPVGVEVTGSDKKFGTCLGGRESFLIPDELIQALKSNIPFVAQNASGEFFRRLQNFRVRADIRRRNAAASEMLRGQISYIPGNATGGKVCLPGTSGAVNVFNSGAQVVVVGGTLPGSSIVVPDWSSASTDIPTFLRQLRQAFRFYTNYEPKIINYDVTIPGFLGSDNTSMQAYWSRNQNYGGKFLDTNEVPNGFADFNWKPAYSQYFLDENNANATTKWIANDTIVITPEITDDWYELVEGSSKVPSGNIPTASASDIETMLSTFQYQWGVSGYSVMDPNSFQLRAITQDFFAPVVKNGLVQWIITVKPQ